MTYIPQFADGVTDSSGNPAGNMVAEAVYPKRYSVAPTISGTATPERVLTAAATERVISARFTMNALDIVSAGVAIKNRTPDVKQVMMGETIVVESDDNITVLYATGLSTAANVGGDVIIHSESDEALIRAEIITFDFEATDAVKMVEVTLEPLSNALSAATVEHPLTAILRVEGYSYA